MEECHKMLSDQVSEQISRFNENKPLPLGGEPGQMTIQAEFFFNHDLDYLCARSTERRPALSISKMKAATYTDQGLEQMVPDQFWSDKEHVYDIEASYGILIGGSKRRISTLRDMELTKDEKVLDPSYEF